MGEYRDRRIAEGANTTFSQASPTLRRESLASSGFVDKVFVADLTFGRNNGKMINLLKKRGRLIAEQEFEQIHETEREINTAIRENYDELTTPNICFITFEEEEATKIAISNNGKRKTEDG